VQHERQPLGRLQGLEYDEQRQADGVRQQELVLRARLVAHDRIRYVRPERLVAPGLPRPEYIEAHP